MARTYKQVNEAEARAQFQRAKGVATTETVTAGQAIELAIAASAAEMDFRQMEILAGGDEPVLTSDEWEKEFSSKRSIYQEKNALASTVLSASGIDPSAHVRQFIEERMKQLETAHVQLVELIENPEVYEEQNHEEQHWALAQTEAALTACDEQYAKLTNRAGRRAKKK